MLTEYCIKKLKFIFHFKYLDKFKISPSHLMHPYCLIWMILNNFKAKHKGVEFLSFKVFSVHKQNKTGKMKNVILPVVELMIFQVSWLKNDWIVICFKQHNADLIFGQSYKSQPCWAQWLNITFLWSLQNLHVFI